MIRDLLVCALVVAATVTPSMADLIPNQSYSSRELYLTQELYKTDPRYQKLARDVKERALKEKVTKAKKELKTRGFEMPSDADIAAALGPQGGTKPPATYKPSALPSSVTTGTFPSDAEIAAAAGINVQTGAVHNPQAASFNYMVDSFAAWVQSDQSIKLGLSLTAFTLDPEQQRWRLNLDVADNMFGGSLNLTAVPGIRLGLGVGYGRLVGESADKALARGSSRNTVFFKGFLRLW
jgi:hypothetical protein